MGVSPADDNKFSHVDAHWFLSLPEKVRRKHFTTEEQILLGGHCENVILDATDQVLCKLGSKAKRSVVTVTSSCPSCLSVSSLDLEQPIDSAVDMDDSMLDSFRWLEDEEDLDLTLDDYHTHISGTAEPSVRSTSRRPSFRRSMSLNSMPFGFDHPPLLDRLPRSHTSTPSLSPQTTLKRTSSRPVSSSFPPRHSTHSFVPGIDQSTKYYQDPEARLKLRVYLASPQKFDEVIEFGFPSLEKRDNLSIRRPSLIRNQDTALSAQTFLNEDNASFFDAHEERDNASLLEMETSIMLSDALSHNAHKSTPLEFSSDLEDSTMKSNPRPKASKPYIQTLAGSREMTLRMTLTRPDLRADEAVLYSKKDDPLALEELLTATNSGDLWAKLPKEGGSKVRKLWHRVSGKG